MRIILTHEQADFDAIASLLAANLLNPEAIPVLPRRLNRNVRAYLTLYGDRLPFVEFEDLKWEPIQHITLVDTQTLTSIKGYRQDTLVHVFDHHPFTSELDPSWTYHIEETGATVTLLVEGIQEIGHELNLIEATLLLLGIYEDTGSLTYSGTAPRDVRSCAWLLEQGANLRIAADFLNHPLSAEQQKLYDRLFASAETYHFHGLTVIIASATTKGFLDEISTIAHKLRDLFDPMGLFVLVGLNEHIQMVARSMADELDVSMVARHFGGGGHGRAAAALIRGRSIESVRNELLELLEGMIKPERTVGQIMSRGPQLLEPTEMIGEAAEKMQRFGHEGYPVVKGGKVIGLLTRRAVDRAISHGMGNIAISKVMETGNMVVSPVDSVKHLQRVMMESGWGQLPVADPESGEIVGIVTRTDLLKTLAGEEGQENDTDLVERLERALPDSVLALLRLVADEAEEQDAALYIVGGFVRDLLLGAPSVDFDLVVEGDAIRLARSLTEKYEGRMSSHRRFGTAKWRLDLLAPHLLHALKYEVLEANDIPTNLDLVSARTEFYRHPTALPSVVQGSIKLDLHRRDFSINTLALRLDGRHYGELMDHWGGVRDLREGLIRVLHSLSFVDDPTRMLRAVRLEQRLGFAIESHTMELLKEALPLLDRVSGDRIRHELESIFHEAQRIAIMRRLNDLGLLAAIHPALTWNEKIEEAFLLEEQFHPPDTWRLESPPSKEFLYYAFMNLWLIEEDVRSICRRLHFSAPLRNGILHANRLVSALLQLSPNALPSALTERMEQVREEALVVVWLGMKDDPSCRQAIEQYLSQWRYITPITTGDSLRKMDLPPGPAYRRILHALRTAWLDGLIANAEDERKLLAELTEEVRDGE